MKERVPARAAIRCAVLLLLAVYVVPVTAHAHAADVNAMGFLAGLQHPWTGLDHVTAMLAIGLWAHCLRDNSVWFFLGATAIGIVVGVLFGAHPGLFGVAERIAAFSAVALGLLAVSAGQMRVPVATLLVAVFCAFHGYVHGVETPRQFSQLVLTAGFLTSMLTLQVLGVLIAAALTRKSLVRGAAACCSIAGLLTLVAS